VFVLRQGALWALLREPLFHIKGGKAAGWRKRAK
jgi:hypothetical protein